MKFKNSSPFIIKSKNVLIRGQNNSKGKSEPASLLIEDGKIAEIGKSITAPQKKPLTVYDYGDLTIMSGLVDTHAHINEPGRTEWEGFRTATQAAAAGGITTIIDMPLNSIPATTHLQALELKMKSAHQSCTIDYGFWGGVIPNNSEQLEPMIRRGVMGFKCFLCPSGVDEFPYVSAKDLLVAMPILAKHKVPLLVHAEIESPADSSLNTHSYQNYLKSRPDSWELNAVRLMIDLARKTGCRTHIVHLSTATALPAIQEAQRQGVPITVETCPHYLFFDAEEIEGIKVGATQFKCAPPIREHKNRELLWEGVRAGVIEFIVSDHSPCSPSLKLMESSAFSGDFSGDFKRAWGGIAGLQFSLSAVWTEMRTRGFSLSDLNALMSYKTAHFLGIENTKGQIQIGNDADLVVFDPEAKFVLKKEDVLHRHKETPYLSREFFGKVLATFVRGQKVFGPFDQKVTETTIGMEILKKGP